jgi:catechol 2,3-dioxygenase-like lactoylglutathione lyase family enzyme
MPDYTLLHTSLLIADVARSEAFYRDLLGFSPLERAPLPYPGLWFGLTEGRQLHLLCLPGSELNGFADRPGGRDRHSAFGTRDLADLRMRLDVAGVPYTLSQSGRAALFCRDPDNNALEFIQY